MMEAPEIKPWIEEDGCVVIISDNEESDKPVRKKLNANTSAEYFKQKTTTNNRNTNAGTSSNLNGRKVFKKNHPKSLKRKRDDIDLRNPPNFISLPPSSSEESNDDEQDDYPDKKRTKFDVNQNKDVPFRRIEAARLFESDKISEQIKLLFEKYRQQDSDLRSKQQLQVALENAVRRVKIGGCKQIQVYLVGSSTNGFGQRGSDADYCVVVDSKKNCLERPYLMQILRETKRLLSKARFASRLQLIPAKVPILKFQDNLTGMECDININNLTGIRNTQLMLAYSRMDPRVKPLALCIKLWAQQNKINNASQGTLSSYALLLMTVFYLQVGVFPAVLPSLQLRHPNLFHSTFSLEQFKINVNKVEPFRSDNTRSLSELFRGFFEFYSNFPFRSYVMSVRLACRSQLSSSHHTSFQSKGILIEEPFEKTNVARAVYSESHAVRIVFLIQNTNDVLKSCKNLQDIIPFAPNQIYKDENTIFIDN